MTTCYIDIEGTHLRPVEVGLILVRRETQAIIDAKVFYGRVYDKLEFNLSKRHCHGMNATFLYEDGLPYDQMETAMHDLLVKTWKPLEIVGFGRDCLDYLKICKIDIPYRNVILPGWVVRDSMAYHKLAFLLKSESATICATCCMQSVVHPFPIVAKTDVKRKHGQHCAFYDGMELALFENSGLLCRMLLTHKLEL